MCGVFSPRTLSRNAPKSFQLLYDCAFSWPCALSLAADVSPGPRRLDVCLPLHSGRTSPSLPAGTPPEPFRRVSLLSVAGLLSLPGVGLGAYRAALEPAQPLDCRLPVHRCCAGLVAAGDGGALRLHPLLAIGRLSDLRRLAKAH